MKKRYIVLLLTLISIYLVVMRMQNRFTVENKSGQTITKIQVVVCQQTFTFYNVPAGGKVWSKYQMRGDSDYHIVAVFADGNRLETHEGYVTNGFSGLRDVIVVQKNRIAKITHNGTWPL